MFCITCKQCICHQCALWGGTVSLDHMLMHDALAYLIYSNSLANDFGLVHISHTCM